MSASRLNAAAELSLRRERIAVGLATILVILAGIIVYKPAMRAPYFADSLMCIFPGWPVNLGFFLTHHGYDPHSFRPLQNFALTAIQNRFGWETWPIHAIELFLHICLCGLIFIAARALSFSLTEALLAFAFAALWQFAAMPIAILALADAGSALFGFASLVALVFARRAPSGWRMVLLLGASILSFGFAVFSKETSAGYLGVIIICIVLWEHGSGPMWVGRVASFVAPYLAVEAVYFALRLNTAALRPGDVYVFGANLIVNAGLVLVSATSPVSSVIAASAIHNKDLPIIVAVAAFGAIAAVLTIAGVAKSGRVRLARLLLILVFVALGPVLPLRHVSELYMYGAMPFLALINGLAMGTLVKDRNWRVPVSAFIVLSLTLNAQASYTKAKLVDANGRSAMTMIEVIRRVLPDVPKNGRILLVDQPLHYEYSAYLVYGAHLLQVGAQHLGAILGRPDVAVDIMTPAQAELVPPSSQVFVFSFEDSEIRGPQHGGAERKAAELLRPATVTSIPR